MAVQVSLAVSDAVVLGETVCEIEKEGDIVPVTLNDCELLALNVCVFENPCVILGDRLVVRVKD